MKAYKLFFMQNVDWTTPFMTFTVMAILLLKYIISTGKQNRLQILLKNVIETKWDAVLPRYFLIKKTPINFDQFLEIFGIF